MLRYTRIARTCRSFLNPTATGSLAPQQLQPLRYATTTPTARPPRKALHPSLPVEPVSTTISPGENTGSQSANVLDSVRVFEAVTPWYFRRWVWLIVGLNLAWVVFEVDTMLEYFVEKVEHEDGSVTYEKKPLWQRLGASAIVVLGSGCFVGGVLITRRRNVRVIDLIQKGKAFYVETAADTVGSGRVFDRKDCVISPNRSDDWMDMLVKGVKGKYSLRLRGAKVGGVSGEPVYVRKGLYDIWYGKGGRAT
ncbi:hypothetical protein FRB93_000917 [Tulasnella sp. JGI-2019a]|nr:hypothetical protein FRB93_000917 [Tulasnella sp. JGI-2019a]